MPDVPGILHRQGEWQRSLASLSWAEKVRMAEAVRGSVEAMARLRAAERGGDPVGCPYRAAAIRERALLEASRRGGPRPAPATPHAQPGTPSSAGSGGPAA